MTWVVAGVAVVGVAGAAYSADASKRAANAQAGAANNALNLSERQYDLSRQDAAPFIESGKKSLSQLDYLLGTDLTGGAPTGAMDITTWARRNNYNTPPAGENWTPEEVNNLLAAGRPGGYQKYLDDYESAHPGSTSQFGSLTKPFTADDLSNDPIYKASYESGLKMGRDAIMKAAAARGGLGSPGDVPGGGIMKDLTQFATDYTASKGNEAFNRNMAQKQSIYGMLSGNQTIGLNATNAGTNAGIALNGQMNDLTTSGANARAAGIVGGANAWNQGLGQAYNVYNNDRIYSMLSKRGTTPTAATAYSPTLDASSYMG